MPFGRYGRIKAISLGLVGAAMGDDAIAAPDLTVRKMGYAGAPTTGHLEPRGICSLLE
jgi:hypothetical protein